MALFLRMLAAICWLMAVIVLVIALPAYRQQYRILQTWPAAEAEVVSSRVVEHPTSSGPLFSTELQVAFSAAGQAVSGEFTFPHESTSRERKEKQAARYRVGSRHEIRYNPADPSDVRIRPGYNPEFFVVPLFLSGVALIFAATGTIFWGVAVLFRKRSSRTVT